MEASLLWILDCALLAVELSRGVVWCSELPRDVLCGDVEDECEEGSKVRYKNRVDTNCCNSMIDEVGYKPGHYKTLSGSKCERCSGSTKSGP